ncbi:acylneuraminate cytidylyltransferase family protein [Acetoanaerobium noterae]|uniref:acylneuraminate cytidylyltransferase family protein n=1 Tax=Acetoanaerobium noterae TaxID=745369 RepID=UPI00333F5C21
MIAIIPARGGSKGVPKKNIKLIDGKPLIYYTIKAAKESKAVSRIIVSTDCLEIASVAKELGAEVPFLRPEYLATDTSKAIDAYLYTIEKINNDENKNINEFMVLLPTSPFRTSDDIDSAVKIFCDKNADTVISVVEATHPPTWYKKISSVGVLEDFIENADNSLNRQEAQKTYLPNGAIYIFKYDKLKENNSYYNKKTFPYIMSIENSIDIDTFIDFKLAKLIMEEKKFR